MSSARRAFLALALCLSAFVVSCAADDGAGEDTADATFPPVNPDVARPSTIVDLRGQDLVEIEIRDNVFDERFFRVDPGTQIVFVNRGANTHDVTASAEGAFPKITKEALAAGSQALVLTAEGDYPFYCSIHGTQTRGQTGYVVVGGA